MSIEITGARIWLRLPYGIVITETQVNMWLVMLVIAIVCKWLTHNLQVKPTGRRQVIAEYLVKLTTNLVKDKMGEGFKNFALYCNFFICFVM